jgi:hypothetical protein
MDQVRLGLVHLGGAATKKAIGMRVWNAAKDLLLAAAFLGGILLAFIGGVCMVGNFGTKDDYESTLFQFGFAALAVGVVLSASVVLIMLPSRRKTEKDAEPE